MEKSSNSVSPSKAREWKSTDHDSSWNFYIENFYSDNTDNDDEANCISTGFKNTSHAGSLVKMPSKGKSFEKVCCGKRKREGHLVYDDALQDTASSPVNTPKEEIKNIPVNVDKKIKETGVIEENGKEDAEISELKKIGLCLVPISLAEEYIKR